MTEFPHLLPDYLLAKSEDKMKNVRSDSLTKVFNIGGVSFLTLEFKCFSGKH